MKFEAYLQFVIDRPQDEELFVQLKCQKWTSRSPACLRVANLHIAPRITPGTALTMTTLLQSTRETEPPTAFTIDGEDSAVDAVGGDMICMTAEFRGARLAI